MTEDDWITATDPQEMLRACGTLSDRKRRLFAVACCRHLWSLTAKEPSRRLVEAVERLADGEATAGEVEAAWRDASAGTGAAGDTAAWATAFLAVRGDGLRFVLSAAASVASERGLACLFCDILGNPYLPLQPLSPAPLGWSDGLVVRLAEAAYAERELPCGHLDNARLAVLADALEDAGCTDDWLVGHLRSEGPHVRGCVAIDLLTGRE